MVEYACACLNIRIRAQPTDASPPNLEDNNYLSIYTEEQGIFVVHHQLTLRTRTRPRADAHTKGPLLHRHTSLTCLICGMLVYRVTQSISSGMDGGEGPVMPTEEWVEHEILKSTSGWIELSKRCLSGEAISKAASSDSFSPTFHVVLPSLSTPPPVLPVYTPSSPPTGSDPRSAPRSYLAPLASLFPPVPFTPSHPVFGHLSFVASQRSQTIRNAAEKSISELISVKVSEIELEETELRRQVQVLWTQFREKEEQLGQDLPQNGNAPRDSSAGSQDNESASGRGTPQAIHDFVPVPTAQPRATSRTGVVRAPSALSTSLATSSFHRPRARAGEGTARVTSPTGARSVIGAGPTSPSRGSPLSNGSESVREAFHRNMREDIDTATSFKYVVDIEAERERAASARGRQGRHSSSPKPAPTGPSSSATVPRANHTSPSAISPAETPQKPATPPRTPPKAHDHGTATQETPSPSRPKGKRKVTFDIKPSAEKEGTGTGADEISESKRDKEAEIFDLEDDDANAVRDNSSKTTLLPLVEAAPIPARPARHRSNSNATGLPQSLSTLRPTSLPAPAALRVSSAQDQPLPPHSDAKANGQAAPSDEEILSPRETELARLVAASTPSHRNAWKKDSKAWKLFSSRSNSSDPNDFEDVDEGRVDDEEADAASELIPMRSNGVKSPQEDWSQSIAASLPISIGPPTYASKKLGVSASVAKDQESKLPPIRMTQGSLPAPGSSVALRKAVYATRDRGRSLDPGALDFEAGDEDEENDKDDETESGSRGRRNALKILKARSELPAEGMWRSLAT